MLVSILVDFFKYKVVQSIIILTCWSPAGQVVSLLSTFDCILFADQLNLVRKLSRHGVAATFSCDTSVFKNLYPYQLQGVVYIKQNTSNSLLEKVKPVYFSNRYKWLLVGDNLPSHTHQVRYDAEMTLVRADVAEKKTGKVGHYSEEWYNGSYAEYVEDETLKELDAGIRCGYGVNEVVQTLLWGTTIHNSSMLLKLWYGEADISGAILRILDNRLPYVDYIMPIWPFK
ncbi:Uncharacterized protein OBRU01_04576 [Operophtera brumata]|uniref:Uncharacterized protein n=1 Tax=Operophtera brumata TaxID=104452 RepID=A0A0L7LPE1_OPEBR|nr:Uncharacterized protein OBRU01_04576 [Operophtera brumata]